MYYYCNKCKTNCMLLKVVITITNEASSVATAYGDNLRAHEDHCRYTVRNKGPRRNRQCAFPFRFDGKMYDGVCTNAKVCTNNFVAR